MQILSREKQILALSLERNERGIKTENSRVASEASPRKEVTKINLKIRGQIICRANVSSEKSSGIG